MPFGKDIQKEVENALYNYDKLSNDDIFKKHINLALEYFKERPHLFVMTDFYFIAKLSKYRFYLKEKFYQDLSEKIGFTKQQIFRIKNDVITRIVITLAIDGVFEL